MVTKCKLGRFYYDRSPRWAGGKPSAVIVNCGRSRFRVDIAQTGSVARVQRIGGPLVKGVVAAVKRAVEKKTKG